MVGMQNGAGPLGNPCGRFTRGDDVMTDLIQLKETKLKTGATLEDYRDFVERGVYYVDKTWFIREFLRDAN